MVEVSTINPRRPLRKMILIGLAVFLLVAAATTIALVILIPKNNTATVQSAKMALDQFTKKEGAVLAKAGYGKSNSPSSTYIFYDDTRQYALYVPVISDQYVKYDSKSLATNDAKTTQALASFIQKMGLEQINTTNLSGISLDLFSNDQVTCQVSDIDKVGTQSASYIFACLDESVIINQYKNIDSLLSKAQADIPNVTTVKAVAIQTITDNYKQLLTLTTTNKNHSSSTLYFLDTGSGASYIGLRPTPSVDDENSFTIPDKLRQAIDSSTEKAFLEKYIQ